MMNIDQIYKQALMEQAARQFQKISQEVAKAISEQDKELTIRQYDPPKLRQRIGKN